MTDFEDEPALTPAEDAPDRHLEDDLRELVDRGWSYARAEVELQKARAGYAAGRMRTIALLGLGAVMLAFFALVALTVGLVIALTPIIGAIAATIAVFAGLGLAAALCAGVASAKWRGMIAALSDRPSN